MEEDPSPFISKRETDAAVQSFRDSIEEDNDLRIRFTSLGYKLGGKQVMVSMIVLSVALVVLDIIALAVISAVTGKSLGSTNWFWLCVSPGILSFILPFIFYKPRYLKKPFLVISGAVLGGLVFVVLGTAFKFWIFM